MNIQLRECTLPDGCELAIFEKVVTSEPASYCIEITDGGNFVQVECDSERHANTIFDAFYVAQS